MSDLLLLKCAVDAYANLKSRYLADYELVSKIRDIARTGSISCEDLVNFVYVLREMSKLANDLRKELDGVMNILEGICCVQYVTQHADTPEKAEPIRAMLATGSPTCRLNIRMPKLRTEPELYYSVMAFFGVSREAIDSNTIKAYWPGLCDAVTQLAEQGKALPPGLDEDRTYPTYSLTVRAQQNLDELARTMTERRQEIVRRHEQEGLNEWKQECMNLLSKKGKKQDGEERS